VSCQVKSTLFVHLRFTQEFSRVLNLLSKCCKKASAGRERKGGFEDILKYLSGFRIYQCDEPIELEETSSVKERRIAYLRTFGSHFRKRNFARRQRS